MTTILVAEDDPHVQLLIEARLKSHYEVVLARDGAQALELFESRGIDLVITDVTMPRLNGFDLVAELRRRGHEVPVLILTARESLSDKHTGFASGTDDYVTKPVPYDELLWRVQALLRRARIHTSKQIVLGAVVLDSTSYTLTKAGVTTTFPKKEFELLFKLLSYPGQIFTKAQLLESVWGNAWESGEDTVKTHISRLRGRLEGVDEFSLVAEKGLGYRAVVRGTHGK